MREDRADRGRCAQICSRSAKSQLAVTCASKALQRFHIHGWDHSKGYLYSRLMRGMFIRTR